VALSSQKKNKKNSCRVKKEWFLKGRVIWLGAGDDNIMLFHYFSNYQKNIKWDESWADKFTETTCEWVSISILPKFIQRG